MAYIVAMIFLPFKPFSNMQFLSLICRLIASLYATFTPLWIDPFICEGQVVAAVNSFAVAI
jgi:hypothetical protein